MLHGVPKNEPRRAQDGPKRGQRRPKTTPRGRPQKAIPNRKTKKGPIQDGLGVVLDRSFFRLAIRDNFFGPLGCLLESFWGVFGFVLGHLGLFWARFWALRVAFWKPLTLYVHQLINASTLQPVARQHFVTRAGGLSAERLNKGNQ